MTATERGAAAARRSGDGAARTGGNRRGPNDGTRIAKTAFDVQRSVEARDRVGLLAALLRRLAFHSLFPAELRLETDDGIARDRLWPCSAGGATPTPRVARTLGASLDALARYRD